MKLKTVVLCIAAAMLPALASAADSQSLRNRLTLEQGMTMVSDGLYLEKTATGESYVATNTSGRRALALKVRAVQLESEKRMKDRASTHAQGVASAKTEALLQLLETPQSKRFMEREGYCSGGAQLYASASATNGTAASAYAVNALDFGPVTPTANYADAYTDNTGYASYGTGYGAAQAQTYESPSCFSNAYASVTCPNDSAPAVVAWAFSRRNNTNCLL
jgi:hypothetical protein